VNLQNLPGRSRYLLELVVVFFGVWLGLLAEDYRESRQELMAEQVSLARLVHDLEFDRQDMTGNLQRASDGRAAAAWLLERTDATAVDRDSLAHYLHRLQYVSILIANTSEYTALKSAGRINIIRDTDLRQRLTQLYESYPFVAQVHEMDNSELRGALELIAPYVRFGLPDESGFPLVRVVGSSGDVLSQPGFLLALSQLAGYRGVLEASYGQMLNEIEALRAQAMAQLE
jgi:hypothetical protein